MPEFWLVVSIGHCGTKWLAWVLDSREDVTATHELKQKVVQMAWFTAARYERRHGARSARYRPYFEALQRAVTPIVCDANSWVPWAVPDVHAVQSVDRVIYLVRHGVPQLHSLVTRSGVWAKHSLESYEFDDYLRRFWEIASRPDPPWAEWDQWKRLCLLWCSNGFMPGWLRGHGLKIDVCRFEDLTRDVAALREFLPDADGAELRRWQRTDINRKVRGSRRPADIWQRWPAEQREAFVRICGPAMRQYGYDIPV